MYHVDAMGVMIGNQRKKLGMNQKELAEKLGVSVQAISKWETGVGFPDITIIPAIAETLDLSLNELFGALPLETADENDEPFSLPAKGNTAAGREELPFSEAPRAPEFADPFANDGDDSPELRAHLDELLDDAEQAVKATRRRIVVRPKEESRQDENTQSGEWHWTENSSGGWDSAGNTSGEWYDTNRQWNANGDPFEKFGKAAEKFGEKTGKWAEKFGEKTGKWGEQILENLESTMENGVDADISAIFRSNASEIGVPREWTFPACPCLSLHIYGRVYVTVRASDDGQTHVFAHGTKGFLDTLNINQSGDMLRVSAHPVGKASSSPVKSTLEIQTSCEAGDSVEILCTGSGKVECTPFYDRATLSVVGSAKIRFGNSRTCQASVAGAGAIAVGRCEQLQMSVSGAGSASFAYAEDVRLTCSGNGSIRGGDMMGKVSVNLIGAGEIDLSEGVFTEVSAVLSGAGNLDLGILQAEKAKLSLAGDGRIRISGGETRYLQVVAGGGGRISAETLTAETADVRLSGTSRLTLHAVRTTLNHSVSRESQLNIQEYPMG